MAETGKKKTDGIYIGKFKLSFNAPVILCFVLISLGALLLSYVSFGKIRDWLFMSYHAPKFSIMTIVRFFTHVLGHAGWDHFIGNMAYLLLLGPMLEEKYGSKKVLAVILVTAFVTAIINYLLFPNIAICGASGVVFAMILMTSFTSFKEGEIPLTFILVAIIYLGKEIFDGIFMQDDISNLSHILGGIVGGVFGYVLNIKKSK